MFIILLTPALLYIIIQFWQTATLYLYKDKIQPEPIIWPEITIFVAARNEENNIANCLYHLCNLDYPKDKLHIIIGNDQSSDRTGEIAETFANEHSNLSVVHIIEDGSGLKAKARVIAQLDTLAKGEFYLVTDADVTVKPQWAKFLVRHMSNKTGVASGTTMVQGKSLWGQLQGVDWAYFMGMLNAISYNGIPATSVGNNMIIRSEAYWQTGGYRAIRFSITEDYKLYSEVCKLGWKWDNIMIPEVLAYSAPTEGYISLLHQRKRWLSGGRELPFYWWILFVVFALFYLIVPLSFIFYPAIALVFWPVKWGLQFLQIIRIYNCVGERSPGIVLQIAYEAYLFLVTLSSAFFFIVPLKTVWKGRKY